MSTLSTHVLDTAAGVPAVGVRVHLSVREGDSWQRLGEASTDDDGRASHRTVDCWSGHPPLR